MRASCRTGRTIQPPLLRRAAFVQYEDGVTAIEVSGGSGSDDPGLETADYYIGSDKPFEENSIGPVEAGLVLCGGGVVEAVQGGCLDIPRTGR